MDVLVGMYVARAHCNDVTAIVGCAASVTAFRHHAIFFGHTFEKDPTEEDMCKVTACIKHKLCVRRAIPSHF